MSRGVGTHPLADPNLYFPQYGWVGLGSATVGRQPWTWGALHTDHSRRPAPQRIRLVQVQLRLYGQRYLRYTTFPPAADPGPAKLLASALQVSSTELPWK